MHTSMGGGLSWLCGRVRNSSDHMGMPSSCAFIMRLQVALDGREMLHGGAVVWAYDSVDACGYGE